MTFGSQADEDEAIEMVHRALDAGINFFDTADAYNDGASEEILGKALKGHRDNVVLASKVFNLVGENEHKDFGLSRWHIIHGVEASLKRLDVDCLDILYLHQPDYDTPLEESLAAADKLVRDGKVMYVGMSNYASWQICEGLWVADRDRVAPPVVTQVVYNMLTRGIEHEFLPFCQKMDIGVTVYNPLAGGLLTGKHQREEGPVEGTRFQLSSGYYNRYWQEANFDAMEQLLEIAEKAGKKPVALAFQWLAAQEAVDSIIVGASKMEHLEENLSVWEGELSEDTLDACDRVWQALRGPYFQYNR
jgi:aryl-alcohol dehydrogenase (NADP+)